MDLSCSTLSPLRQDGYTVVHPVLLIFPSNMSFLALVILVSAGNCRPVLVRKNISSTLLGLVHGCLRIKLTKDRLTAEKAHGIC